jgi:plastocyanin
VKSLALTVVALALCTTTAPACASSASYVQVVEKEYSLILSRQTVRRGTVALEAINFGMDAHNLALRKIAPGAPTVRFPKLFRTQHADRTLRLTPGRYTLWCTLADHRKRGMVATLVVSR